MRSARFTFKPKTGSNPKYRFKFNYQWRTQGITPCWISVQRISGYQGYQPDIRGILNEYQEKIDQISVDRFERNVFKKNYCIHT